nr:hypothetical protein [uncultured Cellulosilyticum sp.]
MKNKEKDEVLLGEELLDKSTLAACLDDDLLEEEEIATEGQIYIRKKKNPGAWPSLILGILGSVGWIVPIIGLPITVVGTVLGAMGMGKKREYRGVSIAGFVVNTVFLTAAIAKGIVDVVLYCKRRR